MRLTIWICAAIAALYWLDQMYFFGNYAQSFGIMLRDIIGNYR